MINKTFPFNYITIIIEITACNSLESSKANNQKSSVGGTTVKIKEENSQETRVGQERKNPFTCFLETSMQVEFTT